MKSGFNVTLWLEAQVGRDRAEVLSDAKDIAAESKHAVIQTQRGRMTMQHRAMISAASKVDGRMRHFLLFAGKLAERPRGVLAADWALFGAIAKSWVEKGQVKADVLKLFGE